MHLHRSRLSTALLALILVLLPASHVAGKTDAVGERFEFEMPFPSEPWNPETLSWPASLIVVRAELGSVTPEGQKLKVIPRIANGSFEDLKVTVEITLLDDAGNVVAQESETDGIEELLVSAFSFRLKLPEAEALSITSCRIAIIGEIK